MKVSVVLVVRNREDYIKFLNDLFLEIEQRSSNSIQFEYFFYENNSTDNTKGEIEKFYETRCGLYLCEDINPVPKIYRGANNERGRYMANIRNKIKEIHGELESDYTILLDSDIVFNVKTIFRLITTLKNGVVMSSVYSTCGIKNYHYYDTFAHISKEGHGWRQHGYTCYFHRCSDCNEKLIKKKVGYRYSLNKQIEVNACFGGVVALETKVYNKVKYGNSICEHHSFCNEVRKYGKIVINPLARAYRLEGQNLKNFINMKREMDRHIL